jgi:hypothetical protein
MASSLQSFGGKAELFNDLDLMVLLQFVAEIVSDSNELAALSNSVGAWNKAVRIAGPGVLDLALEENLKTPTERSAMASALRQLKTRVSTFGSIIPAAVLNEKNIAPGVTFFDYQSQRLIDTAARLEGLIADDL